MLLSLYKVVLPVSDIDKAEAFYSHLLGVPGRRVSPGQHHFDCGGMILNCYDSMADGDSSQVSPSPHKLYFVVEDLEAVFERAKSAGCPSLDEKIDKQPWGDCSFSAQDPFTNSLGFLDEKTAVQQIGQQSATGPDDGLRIGTALSVQSIEGETERQAAAVLRIFSDEIWLQFSQPFAQPLFKQGEKVRVQYGDGSAYVYSDTEIVKLVPSDNQYLAISIPEKAHALKRRAIPRIQSEVPITVSVLTSANGEVASGEAFDSKTHDISTGGLRFDTTFPLEKGDELSLKLQLTSTQEISLTAKVMGSKKVKLKGKAVILVGTQFVEMHLDDQIKLLQFLIGEEEGGGIAPPAVKSLVEEPKVAAPAVPSSVEEPKVAAPAVPSPVEEPKVAAPAVPSPVEEPKVAAPAVPSPVEEPKVAAPAVPSPVEEPKVAAPVVQSPLEEPKVAAEAVSQKKELRLAVEEVKSPEEEPKAAAEPVPGPEEEPKSDLSWFASQIHQPEKSEDVVQAAAPEAMKSETAEKAVMSIVQAVPSVQSGKAFLEFSNGYHQPVTLKNVFAAKGAGSLTPLLAEPRQLSSGETQRLDVTEALLPLFNQNASEVQEKPVQILLALEPEPPDQPAPSRYLLKFDKESFTEFSCR